MISLTSDQLVYSTTVTPEYLCLKLVMLAEKTVDLLFNASQLISDDPGKTDSISADPICNLAKKVALLLKENAALTLDKTVFDQMLQLSENVTQSTHLFSEIVICKLEIMHLKNTHQKNKNVSPI